MFVYNLISIELIVGITVIGVLASFGKSIAERIVSLISAPAAFLIAFLASKLISVSMFEDALDNLISAINGGASVTEETYPALFGISKAAAISIGKHILLVIMFWVLLSVFGLIIHFIFKSHENEETTGGKCAAACVLGGVKYFLALMLSLLPVIMILNLAKPVVEYAKQNEPKDTYAYEVADFVSVNIIDPLDNSIIMKVNKYCGAGFVLNAVSDSVSTQNVKLSDGTTEKVNMNDFIRRVFGDGLPIGSAYEYLRSPADHKLGDISDLPAALKDISSDKAMSCFVAELVASTSLGETDDPILDKFISSLRSGDPSTYSQAFETVGRVFEVLIEKDPNVPLSSEEIIELLIKSMKDKDFSTKMSEALASTDVGSEIAYEITSKALDSVYDKLGIDNGGSSGLNLNMELFKQLFGDENVAKYAEILIKVSELIDELGGMGNITPEKVIAKFDKVGALLDAMAAFEGSPDISFEAVRTIAADAGYSKYFTFIGAAEIILRYQNKTATFEQSFALIRDRFS